MLCRHAFYTLRANGVKKIPKQYLLRRWRKEAVVLPPIGSSYKSSGSSGSCISNIYSKVNAIINQCGYDEDKLSQFLDQLSIYESGLESSNVPQTSASKQQSISSMIGVPKPDVLEVLPPDFGKNKGGISGHRYKPSNNDVRIKSAKEGGKNLRNCRICKKKQIMISGIVPTIQIGKNWLLRKALRRRIEKGGKLRDNQVKLTLRRMMVFIILILRRILIDKFE